MSAVNPPTAAAKSANSLSKSLDQQHPVAWLIDAKAAALNLDVKPETGLTSAEAASRIARYGSNELIDNGVKNPLAILIEQLSDPLVLILIGAAVVSGLLGEFKSVVAISLIVVANAALGVSQEFRAEKAIAALQKMSAPAVRVRRDGRDSDLLPSELVPGDIVLLEAGSIVPADARVIESYNLSAQEASLTGESTAVEKNTPALDDPMAALGDRHNMVFMGTSITYGRGLVMVTDTGMQTELGKIATLIQDVESEPTPLQRRMSELSKALFFISIGIITLGTVIGLVSGGALADVFLNGVAMAVAVVPEGLPAVVTIALALGAQRMLRRRALIRKLPAVETLGSVTVICSDKTGTLTQNNMTVQMLDISELSANERNLPNKEDRQRTAVPEFNFTIEAANVFIYQRPFEYLRPNTRTLAHLLAACALCNDSAIEVNPDTTTPVNLIGDPTEIALLMVAARFNFFKATPIGYAVNGNRHHPTDPLVLTAFLPRVAEVPFSSERKRMTTVHSIDPDRKNLPTFAHTDDEGQDIRRPLLKNLTDEQFLAYSKGAVDSLLTVCTHVLIRSEPHSIDEDDGFGQTYRQHILDKDAELAAQGQRVLGFAYRKLASLPDKINVESIEREMVFVGLVGMIDPPRPEVKVAVAKCRTAGIRPVMITGDHPLTALAIAEELGITTNRRVKTGHDLETMTEAELDDLIPPPSAPQAGENYVSVFARVSPEHKLRIVDAFQRKGHVVAMTGDGVNDAPALKKADIGVAMGITGTAVSKEASAMVILDDNFATIVNAAEEGRTIYANVRKFIKYILGSNIGEVGVLFTTQLMGLPLPLNTLQILWMNLVTDGLPALALSIEQGEANAMQRPPYNPKESIFSRGLGRYLVQAGLFIGLIALVTALFTPVQRIDGTTVSYFTQLSAGQVVAEASDFGSRQWSTMMFTVLVFIQMGHALAIRSERPIWKINYLSNPAVLGAIGLTTVLQIGLVYLPFAQDFFGTVALDGGMFLVAASLAVFTYAGFELAKLVRRT